MHVRLAGLCAGASLALAGPAAAAGGAHVVDDAAVERAGTCHYETWISRYGPERGLANLSPGCTREARPRLEMGAALQWLAAPDGAAPDDITLGPALKLRLGKPGASLDFAVEGAAAWSLRTGDLTTADVIAPISFTPNERVEISVNLGWAYIRGPHASHAIYGLQAQTSLSGNLSLMAETFGGARVRPGYQAGVRWTPPGGAFDLDLLVGRRLDGASPSAITLGLTARR